jgi:signal transduction histidine kinase
MKRILRTGFDRRYVLLPMLAAIMLVVSLFFVAEARRSYTRQLSEVIRDRQERLRDTAELIYAFLESESAQRGYLLTGDPEYLVPYSSGKISSEATLKKLIERYSLRDQAEVPILQGVDAMLASKFIEMDRTIKLVDDGANRTALRLVRSDVGFKVMQQIRSDLEVLRSRESARIYDGIAQWDHEVRLNTLINAVSMVFTLALLIAVGLLATREIRRRDVATRELELEVSLRTAELRDLSEHMLRISEVEKAGLARELHDELGGLLVAMRMDLSQLRRRVQLPDAAAEERWARIDAGLRAGVDLKRRVIEELRPTLLDNMGLIAALRWQAEQSCQQGNIRLVAHFPDSEPTLSEGTAIAVFRTVQEALSNVLKHAAATEVKVVMVVMGEEVAISVEDNGTGLPKGAAERIGSHGLKQMKFRMQAVNGFCEVRNGPIRGTVTTVRFPVVRAATAAVVGLADPAY